MLRFKQPFELAVRFPAGFFTCSSMPVLTFALIEAWAQRCCRTRGLSVVQTTYGRSQNLRE